MNFTVVFYKNAHDYLLSIINIYVDIIWKSSGRKNYEIAKRAPGHFQNNNTGDTELLKKDEKKKTGRKREKKFANRSIYVFSFKMSS